jgi:hypothetical protein
MTTKLKVNSTSGIVITGLKNPNPVTIVEEQNGLTLSTAAKNIMPDEFYGYNSDIEIDHKLITADLALRLTSLESYGNIIRLDAKYPSNSYEISKGFVIPEQNLVNHKAISDFWLGIASKNNGGVDALESYKTVDA